MKYTHEIPKQAGFYWCKMHTFEFVTEICSRNGQLFSCGFYHDWFKIADTTAQWAGPIPKPEST